LAKDIRPLGAGDGKGIYWIKEPPSLPGAIGCLCLVVIDEYGDVQRTPIRAKWEDSAMTLAEAVQTHLSGAIAEADRTLERRRREAPEPAQEKPPPLDPATRRFLRDEDAVELRGWTP
jgi:hypothetical protein